MPETSLNKLLKEQQVLNTDIGVFSYVKSLGEGGNSFVFLFKKENIHFAIKFLKPSEESKLKRFKDEYFCAMQIATHENVVQAYHFDYVLVSNEKYFIIIMKHYQNTLNDIGNIASEGEEVKGEKAWKLFSDLVKALHHLHKNKIIHRDVKPQNIFFDNEVDGYVLGDLGIAHFSDDKFSKESRTKPSERMANFSYSAPEQIDSKNPARETNDIYSLGQVLQWYLTGTLIRGLGRTRVFNLESPEELKWLDSIIERCLRNAPDARFQSIPEIVSHVKELKAPPRKDYWKPIHEFDDAIRRSFPRINGTLSTGDRSSIERFFTNFHEQCEPDDFWYMTMEGGDSTYQRLIPFSDNKWLFCGYEELDIDKLIVYRDDHHPYKNFFVLLISPSKPFDIVDSNGNSLKRDVPQEWSTDLAVYWNGRYIDYKETKNGYYEFEGEVLTVDRESFSDRSRNLQKYAYIIVPLGTATAVMMDRMPTEKLLKAIVEHSDITDSALKEYLDATKSHHSTEIIMYN